MDTSVKFKSINGGITMNFKDYLQRAEFISLQNFLKHGGETYIPSNDKKYSEQLAEARKKVKNFIEEKFPDMEEYDKVYGYFDEQVCVYEEVFFEIGVIVGTKIGFQLQKRIEELS